MALVELLGGVEGLLGAVAVEAVGVALGVGVDDAVGVVLGLLVAVGNGAWPVGPGKLSGVAVAVWGALVAPGGGTTSETKGMSM